MISFRERVQIIAGLNAAFNYFDEIEAADVKVDIDCHHTGVRMEFRVTQKFEGAQDLFNRTIDLTGGWRIRATDVTLEVEDRTSFSIGSRAGSIPSTRTWASVKYTMVHDE